MTATYPKRLIEVDLPIARISAHARREKSIRHGHISTLHIWWARRPLAACRAVICAALWPDPADPLCPPLFRERAVEVITAFSRRVYSERINEESKQLQETASPESLGRWEAIAGGTLTLDATQEADLSILRMSLLDFIADFANWDNSTVPAYLETARSLTQAAHEALGGEPGTRPLVVDPFAGGGSIPLESLRVGADAFASDLNPVSVLLNKVVLEYIPTYGTAEIAMKDSDGKKRTFHGLADAVRYWGEWIKTQADKELAQFYSKRWLAPESLYGTPLLLIDASDGNFGCVTTLDIQKQLDSSHKPYTHYVEITKAEVHAPTAMKVGWGGITLKAEDKLKKLNAKPLTLVEETPIAYLWARTILCEGPSCGAEVPLVRTLWLARKTNRSVAMQLVPNKKAKRVDFQIIVKESDGWSEQADSKSKIANPKFNGAVSRGSATCPCCGYTTPVARVREQLKARHGGANDARLMCVVSTRPNEQGRFYRLPNETDVRAIRAATAELERRKKADSAKLSLVPDEELDIRGIRHTWAMIYGLNTWEDFFTRRQALALTTIARLLNEAGEKVKSEHGEVFATALQTCLAMVLGRQADALSASVTWTPGG